MTIDHGQEIEVKDNPEKERYEVKVGEHVAVLTYRKQGNHITYLHTGVPVELEGQGIASKLARFALEAARSAQLKVVPLCPFVASYIQKHPEYASLVM